MLEQREADRRENQDFLQIYWNEIIVELIKSHNGDFANDSLQFLGVLNAVTKFMRICLRKQDSYDADQKALLIERMANTFGFQVPEMANEEINENFYKKLEAFIAGTQLYLNNLPAPIENPELLAHVSAWISDILRAAVPSFAPPYVKKNQNTETAKLFCENYHLEETQRLRTLLRVGRALGVFVECLSLERTEMGNLGTLPQEQLSSIRIGILQGRYRELKAALQKIGALPRRFEQALMEEERECIELLNRDASAELPHRLTQEIYRILEEVLSHDKASLLNDFMPHLERVPNPDEPLFHVIRRDYYPDLRGVEQAPLVAQALRILDHEFRRCEERERENLLGDRGTLSVEKLDYLLLMGCPVLEQLQILENMHLAITGNEHAKYAKPKKRFGQKSSPYNAAQLNHIKILQDKYLDLISANRNPEVTEAVMESQLLEFNFGNTKETMKEIAMQLLTEEFERVSVSSPRILRTHK